MDAIQIISDAFWSAVAPELPTGNDALVQIDGTERFAAFKKRAYRAPADMPTLALDYVTQQSKPTVRTFGMNADVPPNMDYAVAERYIFNVTMKNSKASGSESVSPVWALIKKGLYKVYPRLGVTEFMVTDFQFDPGRVQPQRGKSNVLSVAFTVFCRPRKSQLVA